MKRPTIAVDAMGGDHAPEEILKGVFEAAEEVNADFLLVGQRETLENLFVRVFSRIPENVKIHEAPDVFRTEEKPSEVLKRRTSSLFVGADLVRREEADGFVSAGNTGALLAVATFVIGRIPGVERPALATPIPSKTGVTILIDAGANAEVKPKHLLDFARMGSVYAELLGISRPKVALLNIGEEPEKGNTVVKDAYQLLKDTLGDRFYGNVESRDVLEGKVDVVVADGFAGNIALKAYEGAMKFMFDLIKEGVKKSGFFAKLGALMMKDVFGHVKSRLDYRTYGGAFFLGVNGVVVKAHGSSDALAIKNALKLAEKGVRTGMLEKIRELV
ncbi:MAG: phosphate acyltransferase [Thermotogota bacterium]|nr:phosphate acyltransferase [Thermotogota bacterium]MDK2864218.1 phosphate acyltransferase [Thermotogota bacterium]HCZ05649.1 phosphate acyltransferase PlsX [Thermotogota bacterium]